MKRTLLFLSVLLAATGPAIAVKPAAPSAAAKSRVIDPTERVGGITPFSTKADLIRIYGSANVATSTDTVSCRVFPGTPDEVHVEFRRRGKGVARVLIGGTGGTWATASGVRVGTPISELETINGVPFDVTGVNWQIPARAVSWKGGTLPPQMTVDLVPETGEMESGVRKKLTSRRTFFDSTNDALKGFVVSGIILEW